MGNLAGTQSRSETETSGTGREWGSDPLPHYVSERKGKRVIRKILIANNGMAATKAIMSMRKWTFEEFGSERILSFVAMATKDDLDAHAEFIRLADSFVEVPSGKNVNNYANVDLICQVAKEKGVDAVWPGWGHASENPKLPSQLKELGITFIGPTSSVMSALGDKIAANILAQTAKVPSIPWSGDGLMAELTAQGTIPDDVFMQACVNTAEDAVNRAEKIGYPVMVKASEGGGGKGIRKAANATELRTAFTNVQAEVPGSPIFMMQLCSEARHLEVQILGDEHGGTLALNGRDCSTQRRFQKIFEEGPPVVANPKTFKEMERAAQRLTALVGYRGAGTVEYLYSAAKDKFYFLELNPRLQVEHPVTEGITGVNLPAAQLQVAMGIPLCCIPDIRKFYGQHPADTSNIDFMTTDYPPIRTHVMAARITAENPDEGFKPTSGKIHSVRFQSSTDCWGYFSVGLNGGIHEYADSQFGHIFARGPNRNTARKTLRFALKNIDISGDIRHPVPYLIEVLETNAFKDNTIDTMWLDKLIAEKLITTSQRTIEVVFYAAVYRAHELVKKRTQEMLSSMQKGQLVLLGRNDTSALTSFPVEIIFDGKRFGFQVMRSREDTFIFSIGSNQIKAKVREQPDGSLYASACGTVQTLKGAEEALGLRLSIGGQQVMLPTVYDPSEQRSDVNGKVVRYLHDEGATVEKGEPFVELEAMKMIMALKSTEAGKISHAKSPGSIVAAGELLSRLELKDPSKVQKIEPFEGDFHLNEQAPVVEEEPAEAELEASLDGYDVGTHGPLLVERLFSTFGSADAATKSVGRLLEKYLANERAFAASILSTQPYDQLLQQLISEHKNTLEKVVSVMVAHNKLPERHDTVLAVLREMVAAEGSGMSCMYVPDLTDQEMDVAVRARVEELSKMPSAKGAAGDYGSVRHLAQQLLHVVPHESHEQRSSRLREEIAQADEKALASGDALPPGALPDGGLDLELMVEILSESDAELQKKAVAAYLHWLTAPSHIEKLNVVQKDKLLTATWTQRFPTSEGEAGDRNGIFVLLPSFEQLDAVLTQETLAALPAGGSEVALSMMHLVVGRDAFPELTDRTRFYNSDEGMEKKLKQLTEAFVRHADALKAAGVGEICVTLPQPPRHPRIAIFSVDSETEEWCETALGRDMWPSFMNLLELPRLSGAYSLQRIHKEVRPTSHIYLGASHAADGHRAPPPELLMRSLCYTQLDQETFPETVSESLLMATEELEHSKLDPRVARHGPTVTSRIFLHFVPEVVMEEDGVLQLFKDAVNHHVSEHGSQMLKLCVDEIEVKIRCRGKDAKSCPKSLRLSSSSLRGGFMRMRLLHEHPDPMTGGFEEPHTMGSSMAPGAASKIQAKRVAARRAGSTYAYDLPGLLKVALTSKWAMAGKGTSSPGSSPRGSSPRGSNVIREAAVKAATLGVKVSPDEFLTAAELVLSADGKSLQESDRDEGCNNVGMIAWRLTMRTPEYPAGRDIVLIANDVTFQAGSFGVAEDTFFQMASEYARKHGIPRIYVSCNSGARMGLVEELKPLYKVKWIDEQDPGKGFEYIYLTEETYKKMGPNTVEVSEVKEGGETRYVITAIIGQGLPSIKGGIGVENLQGSGLIAGETSRAYRETFTLSYITGRSVGIGAYLNRLGQRNIQMVSSPMILTGYSALNKVLGKNVYSSQDQLGGPQIMVPNGITHQVVGDDQQGMSAILDWLSYVPKDIDSVPPMTELSDDAWDRDVEYVPPKQPYDPRDFLRGSLTADGERLRGFFDTGSFREYLEGWGRTVVVGRARLGGIPMGIIAVETRSVERFVPADPANPASCEVVEPQAGQVWFPDSAAKTAQALRDFNRAENLPVMIFANWRGFSGGTRDMYGEILKFGAQIVDALVEYDHPVFVYIPPNGEVRGGAWVVIDPKINPDKMEMYADIESRGGILEPPGIVEVKYRAPQQVEAMHQHDAKLKELDTQLAGASDADKERLEKEIKARERQLLPLYASVATHFADLHDRAARMKAVGVIRQGVEWKNARRYFFWRVKRRVLQDHIVRKLRKADARLSHGEAVARVEEWAKEASIDIASDQQMVGWLEALDVAAKVKASRTAAIKAQMQALLQELPESERAEVMQAASPPVSPDSVEVSVPKDA